MRASESHFNSEKVFQKTNTVIHVWTFLRWTFRILNLSPLPQYVLSRACVISRDSVRAYVWNLPCNFAIFLFLRTICNEEFHIGILVQFRSFVRILSLSGHCVFFIEEFVVDDLGSTICWIIYKKANLTVGGGGRRVLSGVSMVVCLTAWNKMLHFYISFHFLSYSRVKN